MPWQTIPLFTTAHIMAAVAHPSGGLIAVTSAGEVARLTPPHPPTIIHRAPKRLNAITQLPDGSFACAGAYGQFVHIDSATSETLDATVSFTGIAADPSGTLCIAGKVDDRLGVIFRRDSLGTPWIQQPPFSGKSRPGVETVAAIGSNTFLIAGQRGLLEFIGNGTAHRLPTATEHPLRALCSLSPTHQLAGGGGWAQDMPLLLDIIDGVPSPLLSAGGNRVIVGIAITPLGHIWIAQNSASESGWTGSLWQLTAQSTLEQKAEFRDQRLHGLVITKTFTAVFGPSGFLAYQTSP